MPDLPMMSMLRAFNLHIVALWNSHERLSERPSGGSVLSAFG